MDQQQHNNNKGQLSTLLENTWFFDNTLKPKPKTTMVRSNSHPSSNKTEKSEEQNRAKMTSLTRTPSLPTFLGNDRKYNDVIEEVEDEDEPRMGDLIREAMPLPVPSRKLDRMSSMPLCRLRDEALQIVSNDKNSAKVSVESSNKVLLQEKGRNVSKLSRGASIDSSMLPPKYIKGTKKSGSSNSKIRPIKEEDSSNIINPTQRIQEAKAQTMAQQFKSQKSLSDLQIRELQGLHDLGLIDTNNIVSPNGTQVVPNPKLQRGVSLDSKLRRPRPIRSQSCRKPSSPLSSQSSVNSSVDQKASSSQDVKDQIKFWARAVASNVHQE